jgi:hypothetical protein
MGAIIDEGVDQGRKLKDTVVDGMVGIESGKCDGLVDADQPNEQEE